MKRKITRADIMPMTVYEIERKARRTRMAERKRNRRVSVGPFATFYFENYDTMLHQVHEMLAIERGGEAQVEDELAAYNPLIPQGRELIATVMFEIDDPARRTRELSRLGGVEDGFYLAVCGERSHGAAIGDEERTRADGKTSAVHFIRFALSDAAAAAFKQPGAEATLEIVHPNYGHMARLPEPVRAELAADLA